MRHEVSLDTAYFDGIFSGDADPWGLESSAYEHAKFDHSVAVLADRRYRRGLEIGCAQGMLTKRLAALCDTLLGIDISAVALERAGARCHELPQVRLRSMAYPDKTPDGAFDLVVLSEVAYYWDDIDLRRAAAHIRAAADPNGRLLLVHFTGDTDYPQSGDDAVDKLSRELRTDFAIERAERRPQYRLDLWRRR